MNRPSTININNSPLPSNNINNNIDFVSKITINNEKTKPNIETRSTQSSNKFRPTPRESTNKRRILQVIIEFIIIIILIIIFGFVYVALKPNIAHFQCSDTDIFYPYKPDTISAWMVAFYGITGPLIFFILVELVNADIINFSSNRDRNIMFKSKIRQFLICFYHSLSLFALGLVISLILTEIGKRWIGRLRPHFISVCQPDLTKINCTRTTLNGFVYINIWTGGDFCTVDSSIVREARLSFPSGHASFSAYTMLFLIIYLEARLHLLTFRYVKTLIQMAALILALVTALSRVPDFQHRASDVIAGSILGALIALFTTLVLGRVLWEYSAPIKRYDFDQIIKTNDLV